MSVTTTPASPSMVVDDNSVGTTAWSNPSNAMADDGSSATFSTGSITTSHYLKATGFNIPVPGSATINGILVEIKKSGTGLGGPIFSNNSIKLVKGGVISGTDKAAGSWSSGGGYSSYGGAADLWGLTLTGTDIQNAGFGAAISGYIQSGSGTATASVDHIRLSVTYTYAGITKTVSSTLTLNAADTRGIGKHLTSALTLTAAYRRNLSRQLTSVITFTSANTKGLAKAVRADVSFKATLPILRASAARMFSKRYRVWVWVKQKLDEDEWFS